MGVEPDNEVSRVAAGATPRQPGDYRAVSAEDSLARFDATATALLTELHEEAPDTSVVRLSGTHTFTRFQMMVLCTRNTFQYAWDLAKATAQSTDLDAELAAELLEHSRTIVVPLRGADGFFGAEFVPPEDASVADVLAGFLGRTF
jgi:hypothetical protein